MSMYTKCQSTITVKDHGLLTEALIRVWKEIMGVELQDTDIEFHSDPVPLLGYQGDVRGENSQHYAAAYGSVIIRGKGLDIAIGSKNEAALKTTGWDGVSRNRHPGVHNDFALLLEEDGYYSVQVTDYDTARLTNVGNTLKATIAALKIERHIKRVLAQRPNATILHDNVEIPVEELSGIVMQAAKKGQTPQIKVRIPAGPSELGPPIEAAYEKKKTKDADRRRRSRGMDRNRKRLKD